MGRGDGGPFYMSVSRATLFYNPFVVLEVENKPLIAIN